MSTERRKMKNERISHIYIFLSVFTQWGHKSITIYIIVNPDIYVTFMINGIKHFMFKHTSSPCETSEWITYL